MKSAFRRAGLPIDTVTDTVHPTERTRYRNKITLHFSREMNSFGLYREKTNDVIPFDGCHLIPKDAEHVIRYINDNINILKHSGDIKLEVRISTRGLISVLFRADKCDITKMRSHLLDEFSFVTDVIVSKISRAPDDPRHYVEDHIESLDLIFSVDGFRQVNDAAFTKMIDIVSSFAADKKFGTAFDLYCGSGVIGLCLAKRFENAKFYGIEINPESVKDAIYNAEANSISNIEFYCGDAATIRKKMKKESFPELIVVDPPRAGLSDSMKKELVAYNPETIIYVSCNPQTLARDLSDITKNGYKIKKAVPLNMFPMTKHIECAVCLDRVSTHQMKLNPSPFAKIKSGQKTIELRLFDEKRSRIKEGDIVTFTCTTSGEKITRTVRALHRFDSFDKLYKALPLLSCGYTEDDINTAHPSDMEEYYSKEEQKKYGVVGIEISKN